MFRKSNFKWLSKFSNSTAIMSLLVLHAAAQNVQAQPRLTQHYVSINCKAFTRVYNGSTIANWTSGKCGAVIPFRNENDGSVLKRYITCALPKVDGQQTACSVTKTYDQLLMPVGYYATGSNVVVPELPNQYLQAGAWYGYAKSPLMSVTVGNLNNPQSGNRHSVYNIEHELLADF